MADLDQLVAAVRRFRDERDWKQFHTEKELAISISFEAAELLEHFQWRSAAEAVCKDAEAIADELADVLIYALTLADHMGLDAADIISAKLAQNAAKYPISKAHGSRRNMTSCDLS